VVKQCKEAVKFACAAMYSIVQPLVKNKPRRVILYYHGVQSADRRMFEKQMTYLAGYYRVVNVSEIRTAAAEGMDTIVAITFDDAFENVLKNAMPILKALKLPAAIFVPTGNLGRLPQWSLPPECDDKNENVMTAEQVVGLARDGFEIYSHTVSHPKLTSLDEKQLYTELLQSKKDLETVIGKEVTAVSYPHGDHSAKVCAAARQAGYREGFTIEPQFVDDCRDDMRIGRFVVSPTDGLVKFRLKVNGAYSILNCFRQVKNE
jgi:peptidoglycan/xylan/chitin deacetylase (PgdA/CDA1 family)